jgi:hypothetical protein
MKVDEEDFVNGLKYQEVSFTIIFGFLISLIELKELSAPSLQRILGMTTGMNQI